MLTSSHAIYTTWRQLWPTCSRLNLHPTGLHVCAIKNHIWASFHPSKTLQQNTFLISTFSRQISCSCLAVLKKWTHVALNWLEVIMKSKHAADSCVLVKFFPRTLQECNHWKDIFTVWQGCASGVLFPTLSVIPYVAAHHHRAQMLSQDSNTIASLTRPWTVQLVFHLVSHIKKKKNPLSCMKKIYTKNLLSFSFIHEK